jgi:hypothetical protein
MRGAKEFLKAEEEEEEEEGSPPVLPPLNAFSNAEDEYSQCR